MRVADDLSGVKTVSGSLRSPSGAALVPFAAAGDGGSVFTVRITIPPRAETGLWYLGNIMAIDKANNSLIAGFSAATVPPGGSLRVTSPDSDSAAPEVRAVSVDRASVQGGERNLVRMQVDDDRSGVASVTGIFKSPSGSALIPFMCRVTADTNSWEGDVSIPAGADCGVWSLQSVRVADNAGNIAYLPTDSPLLTHTVFDVTGRDCDSTPPTLQSLTLSPRVVSNAAGSEVLVTATVHDDASGTIYVSGRVDGPISANNTPPRIYFSCTRDPNDPEGPWTGKILVPQYSAKGTWRLATIRVQDRALNARDYGRDDPILAQASFDVE